MKRALSAGQMRAWEEHAVAKHGITIAQLMENAGAALATAALRSANAEGRFLVVCGAGNNGGDGLVAARRLALAGRQVNFELVGEAAKLGAEAAGALERVKLQALLGPVSPDFVARPGDVVIDALFGTGLSRAPEGRAAEAIRRIATWRGQGARVVAADLPSGLPSDGAAPFVPCVKADVSVAFGALKRGHLTASGAEASGEIEVAPMGLEGLPPTDGCIFLVEEPDVRAVIPRRAVDSHKGTFGHVAVVAGSRDKPGAAVLCARAVLRSGAGLCTVVTQPGALDRILAGGAELMGQAFDANRALGVEDLPALRAALAKKAAWVAGPGIERGPETAEVLLELVRTQAAPVLLDADALNAIAPRCGELRQARGPVVLTPHPAEMARLLGLDTGAVQADRPAAARELAQRTGGIAVLKGARTLIATPQGDVYVNPTGNPGMATAGSGDVLGGIIAALLAQKISALDAVLAGVYVHGAAGDVAATKMGQAGLIASDIIEALGTVWTRWER